MYNFTPSPLYPWFLICRFNKLQIAWYCCYHLVAVIRLFWDSLSLSGFSVHGISQTRILEQIAIFFSRGSSQTRNQIRTSHTGRQILYYWAPCSTMVHIYWKKSTYNWTHTFHIQIFQGLIVYNIDMLNPIGKLNRKLNTAKERISEMGKKKKKLRKLSWNRCEE